MLHPEFTLSLSRRLTALATVVAILGITASLAGGHSSPQDPIATGTAPEFNLAQIGGGSVESGDLRGNVVVVDLLATWCAPCIQEIPNYNALSEKYKDKRVRIIGIVLDSGSLDDVKAKLGPLEIRYPILFGGDKTMADFGINLFPATFVLDQDSKIHGKYLSVVPNKKELIDREIETLLRKS